MIEPPDHASSAATRVDALMRLRRACAEISGDGTDPSAVAQVVAWSIGPRRSPDALRRRCRDAGSASELPAAAQLAAAAGHPAASDADAGREIVAVWQRLGVRVAVVGDPGYPERLAEGWPSTDGPPLLAWRGAVCDERPAVALVGSRRATGYGIGVAAWLADAAASAGARVVSGGAVGVDAAAHGAALERPGGTTVVLGCGHAVGYPRAHARPGGLFDRIVERGGTIVSELLPHEPPRPGLVRARNRIVAALADVVVVVEGRERSGALLTATAAGERGRIVLAVPGDVRAPGSAAPHRLLADGAGPCTGPRSLLEAIAVPAEGCPESSDGVATAASSLPPEVLTALRDAWPRPLRLDDLALVTGMPVPLLLGALTRARAAGEIADGLDGLRLRRAPRHIQ